jgi:hypothetical protein
MLGLSEPTVRDWTKRGILRIRNRKPRLLLDPASVLQVRQLVAELRQAGQIRGLLEAVYDQLADEQLLADPDLIKSLEHMHRGDYIVRRPAG